MVMEKLQDIFNEQVFADSLSLIWQSTFCKLPKMFRVDYALVKGEKVVGFCEIKNREISFNDYSDTLLSLNKWEYLLYLSQSTKLPVYLAIQYLDKGTYVEIDKNLDIEIKLKTVKGDTIPYVFIKLSQFTII